MGLQEQTGLPPTLKIDHVTIAGPELAPMERAFAGVGLVTDYGGPHSNGVTHMAWLGFNDGSYNELDYARSVANHYKTDHFEYIISPEIGNLTEKLLGAKLNNC